MSRPHCLHMQKTRTPLWALLVLCAGAALLLWLPLNARADLNSQLTECVALVQECNDEYTAICEHIDELNADIADKEGRIDELENVLIPAQKEEAAEALKLIYRLDQDSLNLVDLVLSADSFYDVFNSVKYVSSIYEYTEQVIDDLLNQKQELEDLKTALEAQLAEAEAEAAAAQAALEKAEAARAKVEDAIATQYRSEGYPAGLAEIDWTVTEEEFMETWTPRIDAYLSGTALAGYGSTFAAAAWYYCVDPRLSPAISTVESGSGRNCFLPHNAWGWGQCSWSSWEEAIWTHTKGLADYYAGILTQWGAKKYCPPSDVWYSNVLWCMKQI